MYVCMQNMGELVTKGGCALQWGKPSQSYEAMVARVGRILRKSDRGCDSDSLQVAATVTARDQGIIVTIRVFIHIEKQVTRKEEQNSGIMYTCMYEPWSWTTG